MSRRFRIPGQEEKSAQLAAGRPVLVSSGTARDRDGRYRIPTVQHCRSAGATDDFVCKCLEVILARASALELVREDHLILFHLKDRLPEALAVWPERVVVLERADFGLTVRRIGERVPVAVRMLSKHGEQALLSAEVVA